MKKILLFLALLVVGVQAWGQDTLEFTNRRDVSNIIFGLLNPQLYGDILIDRSFSEDSILVEQVYGNYTRIPTGENWLNLYSSLATSYLDSNFMFNDAELISNYSNFIDNNQSLEYEGKIILPFSLLLHRASYLDTTYANPTYFSNENNQLRLNPLVNESDIYKKTLIKCVSNLDLTGDHGYFQGKMIFDPNFISTSPDIEIQSIKVNLGDGFLLLNEQNNEIDYDLNTDYQLATVALEYEMDNQIYYDTLPFYLTTSLYKYQNIAKSDRWDVTENWTGSNGVDFEAGIKFGCGNNNKIRRPIIIAPPYRPSSQSFSLNKYYDQFDFKSLLSSLSEMGYDIIFLKEIPGNASIEAAGAALAGLIKYKINPLKKVNFPNEDWENIVIGFSAGGQHWRYALKLLEKEHMDDVRFPHHHTRLYIPFDSPHWGANVPFFAQAVYKQNSSVNPITAMTYNSLLDEGSKDMLMFHIINNTFNLATDNNYTYTPAPSSERIALVNALMNDFNHQFTPVNDLRKSFPSFTRNISISTGSNSKDYSDEYGLQANMTLFEQHTVLPSVFPPGMAKKDRVLSASSYGSGANNYFGNAFTQDDKYFALFVIPIHFKGNYYTHKLPEFDNSQGGYKNEFYDKNAIGVLPISPVPLLRWTTWGFGQKHYKGKMNFLPTVSALAINPSIWQNNNLKYDLKEEGLMYNQFDIQNNPASELYGYPHLAHPNNHFNITPFEAVYCDPQTYEHIKMQETIEEFNGDNDNSNNLNDVFLVHLRNFILDEVEADDVYLQNKIIGKNHNQNILGYKYRAWYRAYDELSIGNHVTPKTDLGDYIIEKTGDITVYAGQGISIKPGFHAQAGSDFHAFILEDGCSRPRTSSANTNEEDGSNSGGKQVNSSGTTLEKADFELDVKIYPNPNTGEINILLPEGEETAQYEILSLQGVKVQEGVIGENRSTIQLRFPNGTYFIRIFCSNKVFINKIIRL